MGVKKMRVGVIGAGAISGIYLENMTTKHERLEVVAVAARHLENAERKAKEYGLQACTVEQLLADPQIDMIVNLTPSWAHYDLIKSALLAGKHVYTEKTITDDVEKAKELLELAEEKHLYLGSAPDTFLGAAWQTARSAIDDGLLGEIHSFAISANRNYDLLLSLFAFLRQPGGGLLYDYGVYYLTTLVSLLGPIARVGGIIGKPYLTHRNILPTSPQFGEMMDTPNESQVSAVIQLKNGICGTFHIDADCAMADQAYFAVYGTKGILYLTDPNQFGGSVKYLPTVLDPRNPAEITELWNFSQYSENSRGIGPAEMADAIFEGRPNRASKEMAHHVLEALNGIMQGGDSGVFVDITSTFEMPEPLPLHKVEIRNLAHVAFQTKDMDAMLRFYSDILGMKRQFTLTLKDLAESIRVQSAGESGEPQDGRLRELLSIGDGPWIEYLKLADGQFVELFYDVGLSSRKIEDRHENYGYLKYNFEVADIAAVRNRLANAGVAIDNDIHTTADGAREIVVRDPDGNEVQFTEYPKGEGRLPRVPEEDRPAWSHVRRITQVALQVKDAVNMKSFYCKGLGLHKVLTLTYGDLRAFLEQDGVTDKKALAELEMVKDRPWIDYIEVAPCQYIELFYTDGRALKENRDLGDAYGYQHICLEVSDIHAAWDAVAANGLKPDSEISRGADGTYQFWLSDPDGNRLELMEYVPGSKQLS